MSDERQKASAAARVPPSDIVSERAVLGGILLEPDALKPVRALGLQAGHFYRDAHSIVFDAFVELDDAEQPIDAITLRETLVSAKKLERVGGDEYLLGLTDTIPTVANIAAHAAIVLEKAQHRALIRALMSGVARAWDGHVEDAHEAARQALEVRVDQHVPLLTARDVVHSAAYPSTTRRGAVVRTGYGMVDGAVRAMPRSTMLTLGGRTGCGKSTLMLGMAMHMAHSGLKPGIVSTEDAEDIWGSRLLAQLVPELSSERLLSQQLDLGHKADVDRGLVMAERIGVKFAFQLNRPLKDVLAAVRALCEQGCDVVFVDYLQAIKLGMGPKRAELVSNAAQELKATCQEHGAVLVLGSQLSRPDRTKPFAEPHANDLKESGDLENMSEAIVLLWKTSDDDNAVMLGKVAKVKWSNRRPRFEMELLQNGSLHALVPYVPPVLPTSGASSGWARKGNA
jgi:replicative DNA helicase